jgi:hypothetical protein
VFERQKLEPRILESSARTFKKNITDVKITAEKTALTFRNSFAQAYPGSIHALEGVARVASTFSPRLNHRKTRPATQIPRDLSTPLWM